MVYSMTFSNWRTYAYALLFIVGNIVLPQTVHLIPQGGFIFLPIYFFTLIAAYKCGWKVGLMTAILSPVLNHIMFGMPPMAVLPIILMKSIALAFCASYIAHRITRVTFLGVLLSVIAYQVVGGVGEALYLFSPMAPLQDLTIGLPGLLIQVVFGYLIMAKLWQK